MNANDTLKEHTCSDNYYKYTFGFVLTNGAMAMAQKFECFWLLDIIVSYQPQLKNEEFQVWKLEKKMDGSAIVTCDDGNKNVLKRQAIPFTDFKADTATLWVEGNVILLPSEH